MLNGTNTTTNSTNSTNLAVHHQHIALTVMTEIFCICVLVIGIIGNGLVIIAFGSRWKSLKSFEIYMLNLAVADLIGTLVTPTGILYGLVGGDFEPLGELGCAVVHSLSIITITVSFITITIIALDRYIIVKWPMKKRIGSILLFLGVVSSWIMACAIEAIHHTKYKTVLVDQGSIKTCGSDYETDGDAQMASMSLFVIHSGIPLLLMTLFYVLTICQIKKHSSKQEGSLCEKQLRLRYKRDRKIIAMIVCIVIGFLICVTPQRTFYLVYIFDPKFLSNDYLVPIHSLLVMLLMVNSCINPIIYSRLHVWFQSYLLALFCRKNSTLQNSRRESRGTLISHASMTKGSKRSPAANRSMKLSQIERKITAVKRCNDREITAVSTNFEMSTTVDLKKVSP